MFNINEILILAAPILLALTFHEYSHAYVAYRFGDPTAKYQGRLTMNPLAHLDPLGTLMVFIVRFGWARPVPVNPYNLPNPKQNMLWISAAGPLSNMLLALISGLLVRAFVLAGISPTMNTPAGIFMIMLFYSVQINLALAIFNVIPVAPLDGSKILYGILPEEHTEKIWMLETYGPYILLGIILLERIVHLPILGFFIWPFVQFFTRLFAGV